MLAAPKSIDVHLQLSLIFFRLSLNLEFERLVKQKQKTNQHLNQKTLTLKLHLFLDKKFNQLDIFYE